MTIGRRGRRGGGGRGPSLPTQLLPSRKEGRGGDLKRGTLCLTEKNALQSRAPPKTFFNKCGRSEISPFSFVDRGGN